MNGKQQKLCVRYKKIVRGRPRFCFSPTYYHARFFLVHSVGWFFFIVLEGNDAAAALFFWKCIQRPRKKGLMVWIGQ
jgi:hypothetical protein